MKSVNLLKLTNYLKRITEHILFKIFVITLVVVFVVAIGLFIVEKNAKGTQIKTYIDSLWYMIVTISTTGYGDMVPQKPEGRIIGVISIFLGFIITAVASGVITSVFVEKKLKEGKGLKKIKLKNHIVICGWNNYGNAILESIIRTGRGKRFDIILVNELEEGDISNIKSMHRELNINFVKGNYTNENILNRASIKSASTAILIADNSSQSSIQNADERTILAAMAIKSMNPKIKTSAQLVKEENEEHLKRADVDEIIIDGEFSGFLISNAALTPGIHQLVKELLSFKYGNTLIKSQIPKSMIGKSFFDLSEYFRDKKNSILIGVMTEEEDISLGDILSDDYSAIDLFIKRKFAEAENFFDGDKNKMNIKINPGNDYKILDNDVAFLISNDLNQVV